MPLAAYGSARLNGKNPAGRPGSGVHQLDAWNGKNDEAS